jgi:hypothetical protein
VFLVIITNIQTSTAQQRQTIQAGAKYNQIGQQFHIVTPSAKTIANSTVVKSNGQYLCEKSLGI